MNTFLLLLPDFSLVLLGAALRLRGGFAPTFWAGVERLVYFVLFPALLFNALLKARLDLAGMAPLVLAGAGAMLAGFVLVLAAKPVMGLNPLTFASRLQCGYRFNTYIGMAVAGTVHGASGMAAMGALCGALVPLANILAVGMLARHGQGRLLNELARNPLVLATVSGIVCNLLGVTLPAGVAPFLQRLADASIALGLLAVGAALRWGNTEGRWLGSAWIVVVKLAILPAVAWGLGRSLGLEGTAFDTLVLFAALPTASSAYILATRMGGDGPGVAWLISATTLASVASLSFWIDHLSH